MRRGILFFTLVATVLSDLKYYDLLEVDTLSSTREIRVAFKEQAMRIHPNHPEVAPGDRDAKEKALHELAVALSVLSNPHQRQLYDEMGEEFVVHDENVDVEDYTIEALETFAAFDADEHIELWDYHEWLKAQDSLMGYMVLFFTPEHELAQETIAAWRTLAARVTDFTNVVAIDCMDQKSIALCAEFEATVLPAVYSLQAGVPKSDLDSRIPFQETHSVDNYYEFAADSQHVKVVDLTEARMWDDPTAVEGDYYKPWLVSFSSTEETIIGFQPEISLALLDLVKVGTVACGRNQQLCSRLFRREGFPMTPYRDRLYFFRGGLGPGQVQDVGVMELTDGAARDGATRRDSLSGHIKTVLSMLPPLPTISVQDLMVAVDAQQAPNAGGRQDWLGGKEWAILFISTESDWCTEANPDYEDHHNHLNDCQRALRSYAQVVDYFEAFKLETGASLTPVIFDCHPTAYSEKVEKLCNALQVGQDVHRPELIVLKAESNRKPHRMDLSEQLDRSDLLIKWLQMMHNSLVYSVDHDDFHKRVVEQKETMLVFFGTPWCGEHCSNAFEEFNKAARTMFFEPLDQGSVSFGHIDCDHHYPLCHEYHIKFYPTVLVFINGTRNQFDYDAMTAEEFIRFTRDAFVPNVHEFTVEEFREAVWDPDNPVEGVGSSVKGIADVGWVVDFYAPWCSHCHTMNPVFDTAGDALKGVIQFGKLNCELEVSFCRQMQIKFYPTIREYPADRSSRADATTQYKEQQPDALQILTFVLERVVSDVVELEDPSFFDEVLNEPFQSWLVSYYRDDCRKCAEINLSLHALSAMFRERTLQREEAGNEDAPEEEMQTDFAFGRFNCGASPEHEEACNARGVRIEATPELHYFSGPMEDVFGFNVQHPVLQEDAPFSHWHVRDILGFVKDLRDQDQREVSSGRLRTRLADEEYEVEHLDTAAFAYKHTEL